jgi:drug/metabolite transporter (DMT)-like permease
MGIFARLAYDHGANVAGVVAARAAVVVPLFAVLALRSSGETRRRDARSAAPLLVPMVFLSILQTVTYFVAVDRMSPALVTLVIYIYPAITVIGSRLLGWTSLGGIAVLATALTMAGIVVTLGLPSGEIDALAVACAFVNGISFAVFLLLAQAALRRADPLTVYAAGGAPASAILLAGAFVFADPQFGSGRVAVASILCAGLVSTVLATLLQLTGVRRLGSASTAVVTSLEIVTVVVASALVFADPIGVGVALGSLLIIAGAVLAPRGVKLLGSSDRPRPSPDGANAPTPSRS